MARLESTLAGVDVDESDLGAVTARLEQLIETWKQVRRAASEEETGAAERLRSASTEQVLDFIDKELGV